MGSWYTKLLFWDWRRFHCSVNSLDLELKSSPARLALLFPLLAAFVIHDASLPAFAIWSQLVSAATAEWMIPLFRTVSFIPIIAKILFTYEALYLLLKTGLSFPVCSWENDSGWEAGQLQVMLAGAALHSPAPFFPCSHTKRQSSAPVRCWALRWGSLGIWQLILSDSFFSVIQSGVVNVLPNLLSRDVSHARCNSLCSDAILTPLWQTCPCSSDKTSHVE